MLHAYVYTKLFSMIKIDETQWIFMSTQDPHYGVKLRIDYEILMHYQLRNHYNPKTKALKNIDKHITTLSPVVATELNPLLRT